MKIIDPGSIVSTTEKATAENAPGWSTGMINTYNKLFSDGELDAKAISQFKAEAKILRDNAIKGTKPTEARIRGQAKKWGLDEKNIFNIPEDDQQAQPDTSYLNKY